MSDYWYGDERDCSVLLHSYDKCPCPSLEDHLTGKCNPFPPELPLPCEFLATEGDGSII